MLIRIEMELEMNSEMMMDMRACVSHATLPLFAPALPQ